MNTQHRVPAGVPTGGQFAPEAHDEAAVTLGGPETVDEVLTAPRDIDPDWFARLASHQQRDLIEEGIVGVRDAGGDPVEVRPGIIDDNADWVYKNGQCLALAVVAAQECGGKVYCQRVDLDDADEHDQPFYNLRHAFVLTPDGDLLDIQGAHGGPDELADDDPDSAEPLVFDNPRDALAHFDGYLEDQDTVVAEPFAKRLLAEYRLGAFDGQQDYGAIGPDDAKALLDTDIVHRYTRGDCGVLAHHLAEANGWGVAVVGEYEEERWGDEPDEAAYSVDHLQHAYAVRPDGMWVDVRGVHDPTVLTSPNGMREEFGAIYSVHTYDDAETADRIWNHEQWLDEADERELAAHTARLVTIAYGDRHASR